MDSRAQQQKRIGMILALAAVVCAAVLAFTVLRGKNPPEPQEAQATDAAQATAQAPAEAGSEPSTESAKPPSEAQAPGKSLKLDTFRIQIPPGWRRDTRVERRDDVELYLEGPDYGSGPLRLAVSVTPSPPGQTLEQFAASYVAGLGGEVAELDGNVRLGDIPTKSYRFVNDDGDNIAFLVLHKQCAHVVALVSPAGQMGETLPVFFNAMATFQFLP
jgi:hypothetical protein